MNPKLQKLLQRHDTVFKVRRHFKPSIERIINDVTAQVKISKMDVYKIISAQFLMAKDTIFTSTDKKGLDSLTFDDYKSIRFIYLGAFVPSKNKFNKLVKKLKKEKENNET